jgi:hypothetical protein
MATELVHWCDWHLADEDGSRVLATITRTAQLDSVEYLLELCDECDVKRYQPLATFVQTFGYSERKGRRSSEPPAVSESQRKRERAVRHPDEDGTNACPWPGCDYVGEARVRLGAHGRTHGARNVRELFDLAGASRG